MLASPKTRFFLLLVAALSTMMALALPATTLACPVGDIYECHYPNGVTCIEHDCRPYTCSGTGTPTCYSFGIECCW